MQNYLFFLIALFFSQFAHATNYYVSAAGNDANNGTTTTTPWKTIAKVNTINFAPGDNLYFRGGDVFPGNIYLNNKDGNSPTTIFTISSYGTGRAVIDAGNSYGISAYNTQGIRIENLILNGSGMNTNTQDGLSFYADLSGNVKLKGLSFDNLEVKNFGKTGVKIGSWNGNTGYENLTLSNLVVHDNLWDGILVYGYIGYNNYVGYPHKNVSITNCRSYNNPGVADPNAIRGNGIVLSNTEGGLIENCIAYNNGANNVHCGGPGGIWIYDAKGIVIQHNESYSNHSASTCDGLGFDLDGGSINCIMQYNYSHDNDGGGFLMGQMENGRPWKNNVCRYNISQNDGRDNAAGITLFKQGTTTIMDSCFICNNTVYMTPAASNSSEAAFRITEWYTGITNVKVHNNIFVTTGGVPLVDVPAGYSAYFAGNLYWSSGAPFLVRYQGTNYASLPAWRTATNNERVGQTDTGIAADPVLTNIGAGGTLNPDATTTLAAYQLQTGSPALDTGLDLTANFGISIGNTDYWGDPVLSGSGYDIGADEKSGTGPVCNVPSVLSASPSAASAVLSWGNTGAVSYNLQYKLSTAASWTILNAVPNPYTLTGLTTCSAYQYQVQSVCSSTSSAFSPAYSFNTTGCPLNYCSSSGSNTTKEFISRIQLGSINNLSGNNNGYGNYTGLSTTLAAGNPATISMTPGYTGSVRTEGWDVYIDYNQNGSFADAGERVAWAKVKNAVTRTFTVPAGALNGNARMRIQMKYNGYSGGPCNSFTYGEVEDYTVTISGGVSLKTGTLADEIANLRMAKDELSPENEIRIYPNPASGVFRVVGKDISRIEIYNLDGQKVGQKSYDPLRTEMNCSGLPGGVYFVRVYSGNSVQTTKLIILHL